MSMLRSEKPRKVKASFVVRVRVTSSSLFGMLTFESVSGLSNLYERPAGTNTRIMTINPFLHKKKENHDILLSKIRKYCGEMNNFIADLWAQKSLKNSQETSSHEC